MKMWSKFLDEGGLMADRPADNFDKDILVLGCVSPEGSYKYRYFFYLGRGGGVGLKFLPRTPLFGGIFPGGEGSGEGVGFS